MRQKEHSFWLHAYATFTAVATLVLICIGGLVTSHEAGLAVPDWPTTFGYNMFFFPFSKWIGGIFYEHTHRLVASGVGLLTVFLAAWLWMRESRAWVRWLGVAAVLAVILQGVLGGLRVTMLKDEIGIFHGAFAQLFFVLMCAIALCTSRWWNAPVSLPPAGGMGRLYLFITGVIFCQLVIGAMMRHEHAGLAIPDFPLAYGTVWPDTSTEAIAHYNQARGQVFGINEITAFQVQLQMVHRITAILILIGVSVAAWSSRKRFGGGNFGSRLSLFWFVLVLVQASLGAATVLTNKSADIATAHVACGALSLATGALLTIMTRRATQGARCRIKAEDRLFTPSTPGIASAASVST